MELEGKLVADLGTVKVGEWNKREFVVGTGGQYPQEVKMELFGDKTPKLDGIRVGDNITVKFDLRGKSYEKEGRKNWFTSVSAYDVYVTPSKVAPKPSHIPQPSTVPSNAAPQEDDLPF